MTSPSILVYGVDSGLLHTRALILASRGYKVTETTGAARVERQLAGEEPFDLLLICHSVPHEESLHWVREASVRWPGLKVLVLSALSATARPGLGANLVESSAGPATMLDAINRVLEPPHTAS